MDPDIEAKVVRAFEAALYGKTQEERLRGQEYLDTNIKANKHDGWNFCLGFFDKLSNFTLQVVQNVRKAEELPLNNELRFYCLQTILWFVEQESSSSGGELLVDKDEHKKLLTRTAGYLSENYFGDFMFKMLKALPGRVPVSSTAVQRPPVSTTIGHFGECHFVFNKIIQLYLRTAAVLYPSDFSNAFTCFMGQIERLVDLNNRRRHLQQSSLSQTTLLHETPEGLELLTSLNIFFLLLISLDVEIVSDDISSKTSEERAVATRIKDAMRLQEVPMIIELSRQVISGTILFSDNDRRSSSWWSELAGICLASLSRMIPWIEIELVVSDTSVFVIPCQALSRDHNCLSLPGKTPETSPAIAALSVLEAIISKKADPKQKIDLISQCGLVKHIVGLVQSDDAIPPNSDDEELLDDGSGELKQVYRNKLSATTNALGLELISILILLREFVQGKAKAATLIEPSPYSSSAKLVTREEAEALQHDVWALIQFFLSAAIRLLNFGSRKQAENILFFWNEFLRTTRILSTDTPAPGCLTVCPGVIQPYLLEIFKACYERMRMPQSVLDFVQALDAARSPDWTPAAFALSASTPGGGLPVPSPLSTCVDDNGANAPEIIWDLESMEEDGAEETQFLSLRKNLLYLYGKVFLANMSVSFEFIEFLVNVATAPDAPACNVECACKLLAASLDNFREVQATFTQHPSLLDAFHRLLLHDQLMFNTAYPGVARQILFELLTKCISMVRCLPFKRDEKARNTIITRAFQCVIGFGGIRNVASRRAAESAAINFVKLAKILTPLPKDIGQMVVEDLHKIGLLDITPQRFSDNVSQQSPSPSLVSPSSLTPGSQRCFWVSPEQQARIFEAVGMLVGNSPRCSVGEGAGTSIFEVLVTPMFNIISTLREHYIKLLESSGLNSSATTISQWVTGCRKVQNQIFNSMFGGDTTAGEQFINTVLRCLGSLLKGYSSISGIENYIEPLVNMVTDALVVLTGGGNSSIGGLDQKSVRCNSIFVVRRIVMILAAESPHKQLPSGTPQLKPLETQLNNNWKAVCGPLRAFLPILYASSIATPGSPGDSGTDVVVLLRSTSGESIGASSQTVGGCGDSAVSPAAMTIFSARVPEHSQLANLVTIIVTVLGPKSFSEFLGLEVGCEAGASKSHYQRMSAYFCPGHLRSLTNVPLISWLMSKHLQFWQAITSDEAASDATARMDSRQVFGDISQLIQAIIDRVPEAFLSLAASAFDPTVNGAEMWTAPLHWGFEPRRTSSPGAAAANIAAFNQLVREALFTTENFREKAKLPLWRLPRQALEDNKTFSEFAFRELRFESGVRAVAECLGRMDYRDPQTLKIMQEIAVLIRYMWGRHGDATNSGETTTSPASTYLISLQSAWMNHLRLSMEIEDAACNELIEKVVEAPNNNSKIYREIFLDWLSNRQKN